jgi:hypothetical protein
MALLHYSGQPLEPQKKYNIIVFENFNKFGPLQEQIKNIVHHLAPDGIIITGDPSEHTEAHRLYSYLCDRNNFNAYKNALVDANLTPEQQYQAVYKQHVALVTGSKDIQWNWVLVIVVCAIILLLCISYMCVKTIIDVANI